MVDFVDVFVHRTPVEKLVGDEVEHILINEKERDLKNSILPRREGYLPGIHPETFGNRMKQPNQGELDGKV